MTLKVDGTNGVLQAYDYQVLTTGFTYTFAAGVQLLLAAPAGTLATGTVTMPANPVDGMNITITSTQQITALTISPNTGQSVVGGGAITMRAGGSQTFVYRLANTTWYSQNSNAAVSFGVNGQVFTSTGTFTIPSGVTAVKVTVVGGGGNGAAGSAGGGGSGGGAGGAAVKYLTGLTSGNTLAVTVGAAAGTSSVASGTQTITTVSATGGATGSGTGGAGGSGSNGDLNISGQTGLPYISGTNNGGIGGSSIFSGGGKQGIPSTAGGAGTTYGAGGGGGGGGSTTSGGAGAAGVVIFEW